MRAFAISSLVATWAFSIVSCAGEEFEAGGAGATSGSGGNSGSGGSSNGGNGGSGGGSGSGGVSGSGGTGGLAGRGGSGGSGGGSGGTGGTGGVEQIDKSCATDTDCVVGYRGGMCCGDCGQALNRIFVQNHPCYCPQPDCIVPDECVQQNCGGCPAIACLPPIAATCDQGMCQEIYETGTDCGSLAADYEAKLAAARKCSLDLTVIQCSGQMQLQDTCGCVVTVNDTSFSAVEAAYSAYDAWLVAGCVPLACGRPCLQPTYTCLPSTDGGYMCQ